MAEKNVQDSSDPSKKSTGRERCDADSVVVYPLSNASNKVGNEARKGLKKIHDGGRYSEGGS
jgi:hypothetical protein